MKKTDYKKKTDTDLAKDLKELRESLREFRFSMWGSKTRNTKEGKNLKKKIARILTEIRNRETSVK